MRTESRSALDDILRAADTVTEGLSELSLDAFLADPMVQAAVERYFMIIGEALVRIRSFEPELLTRISDSFKIIGFRNLLVHGYDRVDASEVWRVAHQNLVVLVSEIHQILGDQP